MSQSHLTNLLQSARSGDSSARAELIRTAYDDLRMIAAKQMRGQRQDHTLTATALVHEVSLRLLGDGPTPTDRIGFFTYAARAMRNLLVDHARERGRQKRGGGMAKISFDEVVLGDSGKSDEILAINEALQLLAEVDERKAQIVELRYFGGLTLPEIAKTIDVSLGTVKRDWNLARAWLKSSLQSDDTDPKGSA